MRDGVYMQIKINYVMLLWFASIIAISTSGQASGEQENLDYSAELTGIAAQQRANADYRNIEKKKREDENKYSERLSSILNGIFDDFYHDLKSSGVAFDNAMEIGKEIQGFLDVYLSKDINSRGTDIYAFEQIDGDFYIKFMAENIASTRGYRGFAFKDSPAIFGMAGRMVRFSDPCVCSIAVQEHYPRNGYISLWGTANAEINVPCTDVESGVAREIIYNFIKSRASELLNTEYLL